MIFTIFHVSLFFYYTPICGQRQIIANRKTAPALNYVFSKGTNHTHCIAAHLHKTELFLTLSHLWSHAHHTRRRSQLVVSSRCDPLLKVISVFYLLVFAQILPFHLSFISFLFSCSLCNSPTLFPSGDAGLLCEAPRCMAAEGSRSKEQVLD